MKIHAMLFVGLLLEASLSASKGVLDERSAQVILFYSSNNLLRVRGDVGLTIQEQQQEELLILNCKKAFQEHNETLSTLHNEVRASNKEFKKKNDEKLKVAKLAEEVVLQQKHEQIKVERQRLKDLKAQRLLEKQKGYKESNRYQQSTWRKCYEKDSI